eukprot:15435428-Alexandrium_andersonii.AAC.1
MPPARAWTTDNPMTSSSRESRPRRAGRPTSATSAGSSSSATERWSAWGTIRASTGRAASTRNATSA